MASISIHNFTEAADVKIVSRRIVDVNCPKNGHYEVEGFGSLPVFYHCEDGSMDDGEAFKIGDDVLVLLIAGVPKYIFGYVDEKKKCFPYDLFYTKYPYDECFYAYRDGDAIDCNSIEWLNYLPHEDCSYSGHYIYRFGYNWAFQHTINCGGIVKTVVSSYFGYSYMYDPCGPNCFGWSYHKYTNYVLSAGGFYEPISGSYVIAFQVLNEERSVSGWCTCT